MSEEFEQNLAQGLASFIDSSPTPFHAAQSAVAQLQAAGFTLVDYAESLPKSPGRYVVSHSGAVFAYDTTGVSQPELSSWRIIGAHTDSPNLRVKQHPELGMLGVSQLRCEPYGGALVHTWLDRDLAIAGRVLANSPTGIKEHLFHTGAVCTIPSLAIHLAPDRDNPTINKQHHLNPIIALTSAHLGDITAAALPEVNPVEIVGFDIMLTDSAPSNIIGVNKEFLHAPRLDNLASCFAGIHALISRKTSPNIIPAIVLFDHEEVGSQSERGAGSPFLLHLMERVAAALHQSRSEFLESLTRSVIFSADMAHATHPNYPERHEPGHTIFLGGGPVLKINYALRYATDGLGSALFSRICAEAGTPLQHYVHRADLACGSTIGPISAAKTGILTIDVGAPQLAMHSIRETMAISDINHYIKALTSALEIPQ